MNKLFTIGFTKKTAKTFFSLLQESNIDTVIDIRLNNTSQLAGFAKFPDIEYFLKSLCGINYMHDRNFSPTEDTLKKFKKKKITWDEYVVEFENTLKERNIEEYIKSNYTIDKNYCLLCSEHTHEKCHRTLIAQKFKLVFEDVKITNI